MIRNEPDLIFTLIDLEELIKKYSVKDILDQMNEKTIDDLNIGIRLYYNRKANEKLNGKK